MHIHLELNESQAATFQSFLTTGLQSLVFQEVQCRDAIDDPEITTEQLAYVNNYVTAVSLQRVLIAEILHTVNQAEKKTSIIY